MAYTVFGGKIAYNDVELLGTDGTTGRTTLIKNINTGGSANVGNSALTGAVLPFAVVGNYAYFSATDGTTGQELWRTDGTTVGTTKVTEFSTSSGTADPFDDVTGYNPSNIVAANGYIFFSGSGPAVSSPGTTAARYGIWRYDPNSNTTAFVSDSSLGINNMISNGSRVYWTYDGGFGSGLWTSDGVSAAQSIYSTASLNSPPSALFNAGGTVYLGIGGLGGGVKKVVGTAVSDVTGAPIGPLGFVQTSSHVYMISQSNTLFVTTTASSTATQITAAGLTFDFSSTPGGHTAGFAALGNKLIFSNNKPVNSGVGANTGSEVWITDGTGAGTVVLKDIVAGIGSSNPHNFITVGSAVFFQATNGNGSVEL